MVQINQGNVGSSIHVSIQNGILTMPDGSSIDLKEIQLALNDAFQETGEHDLMKACNQMSKLTLLEVGPNRELLPSTESENLARKSSLTVQEAMWLKQETFPITRSGELKSISDDDLCSSCVNCDYKPGELSSCFKNWPGSEDADGYVQTCKEWSNAPEWKPEDIPEYASAKSLLGQVGGNVSNSQDQAALTNTAFEDFDFEEGVMVDGISYSDEQEVRDALFARKHEYGFDVMLKAAIRVRASSPDQAIAMLHSVLESADCNAGAWPNGDPVLFEASTAPDTAPVLYSIDGEEVTQAQDDSPSSGL